MDDKKDDTHSELDQSGADKSSPQPPPGPAGGSPALPAPVPAAPPPPSPAVSAPVTVLKGGVSLRDAIEDGVLFVIAIALIIGLFWYFHVSLTRLEEVMNKDTNFGQILQSAHISIQDSKDAVGLYLLDRRYMYASGLVYTIAARKNAAFLIGAIIALIGCLVIIRGVREAPFSGELGYARNLTVRLQASSPGLVTIVLGSAVIIVTLLTPESVKVDDQMSFVPQSVTTQKTVSKEETKSLFHPKNQPETLTTNP